MKTITEIAKATILLCTNLGLKSKEFTPYTSIQWYELGIKIYNSCYKTPDKLLGEDAKNLAANIGITELEAQRIYGLLSRGYSLAFSLEELDQRGIGVLTKSDKEYPLRLKEILGGRYAPPVLYYCGDLSLCNVPGIAIVGSRNIDNEGTMCASVLAKTAAMHGLAVYSGGARGVDSVSRDSILAAGGVCIEFVADSMLKKIQSREYREAINAGRLLVLSAVRPDAGFNVANAMNRNKFVYALSQRAFVIASDKGKGGTWAGAKESLSKKYVPVSVWKNAAYAGNNELIKLGADAFDNVGTIDFANLNSCKPQIVYEQGSLFTENMEIAIIAENQETYDKPAESVTEKMPEAIGAVTIYDSILPIIKQYFQTEKEFAIACVELDVEKTQLKKWLDKAEEQQIIRKMMRPKRYVVIK